MVEITTKAIESGLPEIMAPMCEHLDAVAKAAEGSNLPLTGYYGITRLPARFG